MYAIWRLLRPTASKIAFHRNNPPSLTSSTMIRRAPLTPISGNNPSRKKLDLLTKGKIAGQAELGAEPTQIGRSLIQSVLKRLETAPKPRPGRPTVITPRTARALLCYVRFVEICYTYLDRIVPKCVHILAGP